MKKRIIAIAVAVCLLFSLHLTADARGTLSSEYIDSIMVSVQALGDSSMNVRVVIFANAQMSEIGVSSLVVEESKSRNGPWSIKKSWNCSGSAYYEKGTNKFVGDFSFTGTPGYYYRASMVGYAEQSSTQRDQSPADSYIIKCT